MTALTKSELDLLVEELFPDNAEQLITPEKLRTYLKSLNASVQNDLSVIYTGQGTVDNGELLSLGQLDGGANDGYVVPFTGKIIQAAIARGDQDEATFDIEVDGNRVATLSTGERRTLVPLDLFVAAGSAVSVLGGETSPNVSREVIVALIFTRDIGA